MADILSGRAARSATFGLGKELANANWSVVKTGTGKDMRDNWCVGFSSRYTVGVWVGNADGRSMWDVCGVAGAAPVWRDVMDYLHDADHPPSTPAAPAGVVNGQMRFEPGVEPARVEWFVRGTGIAVVELLTGAERTPRIVYPAESTLIALDPDIPAALQRVRLRAQGTRGLSWRLDGSLLGSADAARDVARDVAPQPAMHLLELVDGAGKPAAAA